jgi:hypothetical protein
MKTKGILFICILGLLFSNLSVSGQTLLDFKMRLEREEVSTFKIPNSKNIIALKNNFGKYQILNPDDIKAIKGQTVFSVEVVYTDYPKGENFELLNKKRLASLFQLAPELFSNDLITWKVVKQTGCNKNNAYDLFHGIVITYRPPTTLTGMRGERDYLKNVINGKQKLSDSTFIKVMNRNKWQDIAIVNDFTGSMSPYIAEVLIWHALNNKNHISRISGYTFFNDGNTTPDYKKIIGKTGGIYNTASQSLDSVLSTAVKTIENGSGGDIEENNVEALIEAQNKYPKAKSLVMVADNWANMRDTSLISQVKLPVKVILCGADATINTEYINLAYRTNGSIHTIEDDIVDLMKITEGKEIIINKRKYRLVSGSFIRID